MKHLTNRRPQYNEIFKLSNCLQRNFVKVYKLNWIKFIPNIYSVVVLYQINTYRCCIQPDHCCIRLLLLLLWWWYRSLKLRSRRWFLHCWWLKYMRSVFISIRTSLFFQLKSYNNEKKPYNLSLSLSLIQLPNSSPILPVGLITSCLPVGTSTNQQHARL